MNFFKESLAQRGDILKSFTTLIGEGAENHLIFTKEKSSSLATAVRKINNGLSDGKKKPKSLKSSIVQLISLLQQCPQSLLNAEGDRWVRLCFQNLSNPDKSVEKCLLVIISFILKVSRDNKELCKKLSKLSFMLAQRLSRCHILLRSHNYRCLYENLRLFPNESLSQRSFIEHKLMRVMSSPLDAHRDLVYAAASVYAALPVPGGVGNAPEMKGGQLEQLISLSHCAADAIFYDIKEDRKYNFNRDHKLPINTIDSACELKDPVIRILTASVVLGNCFDFIKIFFEKCVSNYILIKPIDLINLSFRILQVELQSLKGKESIEVKTLSFVLPSLHLRTLSLLKCLIQNNVCTFQMNLVEEQIISTLKSMGRASSNVRLIKGEGESSQNAETMLQSFLTVRTQCYDTLSEIAKVSVGIYGNCMEGLVTNLVADTTPVKDTITLKQAIVGGRLSLLSVKKKNKKKGYTVTSNECQSALGDVSASRAVEQKIPLTIAALKFLETLFTYAHHSYQLKYVKVLQDHLMTLLKTRRLGIYGDPRVREALFGAVIANALYPHPLCPPPYNFIYKALQDEALYSREQVSGICMKGLSVLSFITSNPNTVNWSDVVSLNKESKNVNTIEEIEEPLLNGDANNEESDASDNENDEALEEGDEGEEENESFRLNISDDEIESDNVVKEEVNDVEDCSMEINEIGELSSADKDVGETIERLNNDDGSNAENLVENQFSEDLHDDDDEDSFGVFDMSMNCNGVEEEEESEEEEDIDEISDEDEVVDNEEEKVVVDEEETDTGVGLKRKIVSASDETTKRSKVEPEDDDDGVNPSVAEMLAAFVNEGPDSYDNNR